MHTHPSIVAYSDRNAEAMSRIVTPDGAAIESPQATSLARALLDR